MVSSRSGHGSLGDETLLVSRLNMSAFVHAVMVGPGGSLRQSDAGLFPCRKPLPDCRTGSDDAAKGRQKNAAKSRAACDGGGGGTADPSLSRRAGLCLHPAYRMRGVLSVHCCDES